MSLAKKNNGCYECYKRRLKCDKTVPECLKCQKKGIACSGQGLRCRLSHHMAVNAPSATDIRSLAPASASSLSSSSPLPQLALDSKVISFSQPEKNFRWIDSGPCVQKQRAGKTRARAVVRTTNDFRKTDSSMPDDSISLGSQAPTSEAGTAIVPHRPRMSLRPALSGKSPAQTRISLSRSSDALAPAMILFDSSGSSYQDKHLPGDSKLSEQRWEPFNSINGMP